MTPQISILLLWGSLHTKNQHPRLGRSLRKVRVGERRRKKDRAAHAYRLDQLNTDDIRAKCMRCPCGVADCCVANVVATEFIVLFSFFLLPSSVLI